MNAVKIGMTIEEAAECTGIGRNTMRKLVAACGGGDRRHSNRHRRAKPYFGHCERVLLFV